MRLFSRKTASARNFLPVLLSAIILSGLPAAQTKAQQPLDYILQEVVAAEHLTATNGRYRYGPEQIITFNDKIAFAGSETPKILYILDETGTKPAEISREDWSSIGLNQNHTFGDEMIFRVTANNLTEFWATDGTEPGTYKFMDSDDIGITVIRSLFRLGSKLIMRAYIPADSDDGIFILDPENKTFELVEGTGKLYFSVDDTAVMGGYYYYIRTEGTERHLMRMDGEGNVSTRWTVPYDGPSSSISMLTPAAQTNKLYFQAEEAKNERALWVHDAGTGSTTRLFNPEFAAKQQRNALNITPVGNLVYFTSNPWNQDLQNGAGDYSFGVRLYATDGTIAGTHEIWDSNLLREEVNNIHKANDRIIFRSQEPGISGTKYFGVDAQGNFEMLETDGVPLDIPATGSSFVVDEGVWIQTNRFVYFTDGTNSGTEKFNTNYLYNIQNMFIPDGRPWFTGMKVDGGPRTIWRALPEHEWEFPAIPQQTAPEDRTDTLSLNPELTWDPIINAEYYQVQIAESLPFDDYIIEDINSVYQHSLSLNELTYNTRYRWRVRSFNSKGQSDWSDIRIFTTMKKPADVPDPLAAPKLSIPENNEVLAPFHPKSNIARYFSWSLARGATHYRMQISETDDFTSTVVDSTTSPGVNANGIYIKYEFLEEETEYFWRARAINADESSEWSESWSFYNPAATAVAAEHEDKPAEFALHQNFPNPFNPVTQIGYDLKETANVKLTVYNMLGQEVAVLVNSKMAAGRHQVSFNAADLSSGFYIYRIEAGNFTATKKLMLIK